MDDSSSQGIDFGETYSGMMVGLLLASILTGTASIQAAIFFCAQRNHPLSHKISVGFLWFLDILQLCFVFSATYYYVVDQIGVPSPPFIWSFQIQMFMQTLILSSTKLMYTIRMWKLRKFTSKWLPIGVMVLLAIDYIFGTVFTYEVFTVNSLHDLLHITFKPIIITSMCTTAASDFLVGGALIYTIARSNTNLSWTDSSWTMLMAYLLNTGIITGVFSTAALIAFVIGLQKPVYILSEIALPQFYVNCFFSMMNASVYFRTNQNSNRPIIKHVPHFYDDENCSERTPSLLSHEGVSSSNPYTASSVWTIVKPPDLAYDTNTATINEIGLPLFPLETKPEPIVHHVPLQVKITSQTATSSSELLRGPGRKRATVFHPLG